MSGSSSETELTTQMKSLTTTERPRVAKKSTSASIPLMDRYSNMTRRQAALANKDKSKTDLTKLNSENDRDEDTKDKRHRTKKNGYRRPGAAYDSNGIHISGQDLCDCLQENCPGCHFECPSCGSLKCGADCRVHRKYTYEQVEYHGYEFTIKNPWFK